MKTKRLNYLDGMRTVFCVIVIIHHFTLVFLPDIPFILLNDGNLAVMYFLTLAGFVMHLGVINKNRNFVGLKSRIVDLLQKAVHRYLRLLPIVFISIMFSWLIYRWGGYYTEEAYNLLNLDSLTNYILPDGITFRSAITTGLFGAFIGRPILNTPLWTLRYEFVFLQCAYILSTITYKLKWRHLIYLFVPIIIIMCSGNIYYVAILSGLFLCDVLFNENNSIKPNNFSRTITCKLNQPKHLIFGLLLLIVIYISGFFISSMTRLFRLCVILGIILILYTNDKAQKLFQKNQLVKLSQFSFEAYAFHWPIICSFSCYFMIVTIDVLPLNFALILCFALTLILICIVSFMIRRFLNIWHRK